MAPNVDFLVLAFLPLLQCMGACCSIEFRHHGFHPAGVGRWKCRIEPCKRLGRLELSTPGNLIKSEAVVLYSKVPDHVADTQLALISTELKINCVEKV